MTFTGTIPDLGVLVGYDGSPGGERALAWAARTAADAKTPLYIAMAIPPGSLGHRSSAVSLREAARHMVETAAATVRDAYPHLVVETTLSEGPPADVLLETSRRAGLIVVGSRGHGGFVGLVLGSVSLRVCAHATCPVVVVPESVSTVSRKDIVVGVAHGAPTAAIDFAVTQARRTGGDVIAVHAWTLPLTPFGPGLARPVIDDTRQIADGQRTMLDDFLRPVRARAHDVAIESVVRSGSAASELIELAAGAALVVVSAHRGRSAFPMRIGPTTHAVLHHASCPVAVVPVPHESRVGTMPSRHKRPRKGAADVSTARPNGLPGEVTAGTLQAAGKVVPERVTVPGGSGVRAHELVEMTNEESYAHVALQQVGRVSMIDAPIPFILPVNYKLVGSDIEFSTAADSMPARTCGPVLFEVDDVLDAASVGWSVLFLGTAERVRPGEETGASVAWPLNHGEIRIRIRPERVTGRRVRPVVATR